jgi:hypothetical protein
MMPKFKDLSEKPHFKERVDPTYIADDDTKAIGDVNVRSAVWRVTENLKRILQPIDQRIYETPVYETPEFNCESSLLMYQPVYVSAPGFVKASATNNPPQPMLGIVAQRPEPTRAVIHVLGFILPKADLQLSLGVLYIGQNGQLSTVQPPSGFIQRMGFSLGDGWLYIQPSFDR